jgi:hypothetical protein
MPKHYKTFLHWDDGEEPFVTVFTDMAMTDTQERLPRLERMFSWMVFPQALITNWDRSGEYEFESQIGVCAGRVVVLHQCIAGMYCTSTRTVLVLSPYCTPTDLLLVLALVTDSQLPSHTVGTNNC